MADERGPERIGRYQILGRVGKGGMGVLYRAFDPVLDREVAIKVTIADFTRDNEQIRPRFYSEARAAAKLNHRNIVTIFEFAEESNVPYIVMEFLRGMPLRARMNAQPPLSLDDKLHIVSQLCDGLAYAHAQGVVHRDVKPDNVFVMEDGSVKLLDFGIAKLKTSNLTVAGDMLGSASYMSPEQVSESESVDGRADVFSAGVVLYELLTGHKPFEAENPTAVIVKILHNPPTPMETYVAGLPPALCAAVEKALEKSPANRFATADLLGRELQAVRRMLATQAESAGLEETAFADTMLLKRLNDERQRVIDGQREAAQKRAAATAQDASTPAMPPAASAPAAAPAPIDAPADTSATPAWLWPAVAAGVLVAATAFFTLSARQSSQPASAPAAAAAVPVSGGPSSTTPGASSTAGSAAAGTSAASPSGQPAAAPAPPAPPATPAPADPPVPLVTVTFTGSYPFEVRDGRRLISPEGTRHTFKAAAGRVVTVSSPKYYLRQTVRVGGSSKEGFAWEAPGLGILDIRSPRETCNVVILDQIVGTPPIKVDVAAGPQTVDIVCGGETFRTASTTVTGGNTKILPIQ